MQPVPAPRHALRTLLSQARLSCQNTNFGRRDGTSIGHRVQLQLFSRCARYEAGRRPEGPILSTSGKTKPSPPSTIKTTQKPQRPASPATQRKSSPQDTTSRTSSKDPSRSTTISAPQRGHKKGHASTARPATRAHGLPSAPSSKDNTSAPLVNDASNSLTTASAEKSTRNNLVRTLAHHQETRATPSPRDVTSAKPIKDGRASDTPLTGKGKSILANANASGPRPVATYDGQKTPGQLPIKSVRVKIEDHRRALSHITSPVLLYQAPSHRQLRVLAWVSMVSCVTVGRVSMQPYAALGGGSLILTAAAFSLFGFWSILGTYLMMGSEKMIRSVTAMPRPLSADGSESGPFLQIEFESTIPFVPPATFTLPAHQLSRDAPVAGAVQHLLSARAAEESKPRRARWIRSIVSDMVTLSTRKTCVYVKLPKGSGKIELPGALNLDAGRALEQVLTLDTSKKTWFRKTFFTDYHAAD